MDYYDEIAQGYNELHGEEQLKKLLLIKENFEVKNGDKLLDLGCGTGISSKFGCSVVGLDSSFGLLEINENQMRVAGTAENLPFKDGVFDGIISLTAIHNFSDVKKSLEEMKRVCRDYFIISILRKANEFDKILKTIKKSLNITKEINQGTDLILFGRKA